jgi:Tfp pilus assembly protein PilO
VIKSIIVAAIILGLGCVFLLQKQHEKSEALELKKRQEEAFAKAHATPSAVNSSLKDLREPMPMLTPTPKPKPMLAPTPKPKPTPMLLKPTPTLRKPTPMLGRSP